MGSTGKGEPGGSVVYRWHYDDTGHYAYVLLDADEKIRDVVCRRLRARGIEASVSGASRRPADDGKVYDFFIRVSRQGLEGTDHPEPEAVARAFEGLPQFTAGPSVRPQESAEPGEDRGAVSRDLARLRSERDRERDERRAAQAYAREMREKASRRAHEAERAKAAFESERASLERRIAVLRRDIEAGRRKGETSERASQSRAEEKFAEEIADLERRLDLSRKETDARDAEINEIYAEWSATAENLEMAALDYRELENRLHVVLHEKDDLLARTNELSDRLRHRDAKTAGSSPKASSKDIESLYGRLLGHLVPSLRLERASVSVLATEIRDNDKVLATLRQLDADPEAVDSKRAQTAPAWREVTYKSDEGENVPRVYYLRPKKGEGPCRVFIGHKKSQKQDLAWLRRNT